MGNQFKHEKAEEEMEAEIAPVIKEKETQPRNYFGGFFKEGVISIDSATQLLPFFIFIAFLGIVYIGNRHFAENNIRDIDKLSKEVKELSWDFKTLKADLMLKSTQTEVAKQVDTLGLIEPNEPPMKIVINENEF